MEQRISEAIARVSAMERLFDALLAAESTDPEDLRILRAYYENGLWLHDYNLDEAGLLPPALKRGVLSQDAVYNFLSQIS